MEERREQNSGEEQPGRDPMDTNKREEEPKDEAAKDDWIAFHEQAAAELEQAAADLERQKQANMLAIRERRVRCWLGLQISDLQE